MQGLAGNLGPTLPLKPFMADNPITLLSIRIIGLNKTEIFAEAR